MVSKRLAIGGLLLAGILAVYLVERANPELPDEDRIRQAIEKARHGVVSRNISEIMAVVSHDYEDGDYTYETLRSLILYTLREYRDLQVVAYPRRIEIKGAIAFLLLDVEATGAHRSGGAVEYRSTLRVYLAREPSRRLLVFPDHCWRAVRVENLLDLEGTFER